MKTASCRLTMSACMATYNGSRFIRQQLASILEQTDRIDEVIIVDDASSDETVDLIRSFDDSRIKLIQNQTNLGLASSFEKSIMLATGDVILLCDQDDVWRSDKVEILKGFFLTHPEVTVVVSDANVIDQNGKEIRESWFGPSGFRPNLVRNLMRNGYLGCAMAFRRSALRYCLPIPPRIPMNHDAWIGMLNQIYGHVEYIAEPLLSYRRHGNNVTPDKRVLKWRMLTWRFILAFSLAGRIARETIFVGNKSSRLSQI